MLPLSSLCGLVLSVLASGRLLVPLGGWDSHGPPFPYVSDIAVSPEDELVVYATASDAFRGPDGIWQYPSAVFRSADGGLTWATLTTAPSGERATSIAIDPFAPRRFLASTEGPSGSQVYLTQDGGTTWRRSTDILGCYLASVAFDSTFAGRGYAACGQLLRSDDGVTWTNLDISNIEKVRTEANGSVDAISSDQILRSTDHGASWTRIVSAPAACPSITALAVDPADPSIMYVGTGRDTSGGRFDCGGLYKSVDGGRTLTATSLPGQFVTDVTLDATDSSIVYTCSVSEGFFSPPGLVSRSLDGGQSWHAFSQSGLGLGRLLSTSGRLLYGSGSGGVFRRSTLKSRVVSPRAVQ
jgi:hypothetical protein